MAKEKIQEHLNKIFDFIDIDPEVIIEEKENGSFDIQILGDNLNFLIGYQGESLDALQHLLSSAIFKDLEDWPSIRLDINQYKKSKLEKLEEMVKGIVDRVRFHQKEIILPPLNSYERRHVHTYISDYIDIESESRGEGKDRRLYIKPK